MGLKENLVNYWGTLRTGTPFDRSINGDPPGSKGVNSPKTRYDEIMEARGMSPEEVRRRDRRREIVRGATGILLYPIFRKR